MPNASYTLAKLSLNPFNSLVQSSGRPFLSIKHSNRVFLDTLILSVILLLVCDFNRSSSLASSSAIFDEISDETSPEGASSGADGIASPADERSDDVCDCSFSISLANLDSLKIEESIARVESVYKLISFGDIR